MAKKSIDWKKLLTEKGERLGIGAAGLIALVLIATSVPSLFHAGPGANAKALDQKTQDLKGRLASSKATRPEDIPEPTEAVVKNFNFSAITDPSEYQIAAKGIFSNTVVETFYRHSPLVLLPTEGATAAVQAQLQTYVIRDTNDKREIKIAMQAAPAGTGPAPAPPPPPPPNMRRPPPRRGRGQPPLFPPFLGNPNGAASTGYESNLTTKYVKVEDLDKEEYKNARFLETVQPTRLAMIVAAFPYRQQVLEFKNKLGKANFREVLEEASQVSVEVPSSNPANPPEIHYLEAFRFLGVDVRRAEVDRKGNVLFPKVGDNGYVPCDVGAAFASLVVQSGGRTEPEDKALDEITPDGLAMRRLLSMRANQYPPLERELPAIKQTLEEIEKKTKANQPVTVGIPRNFTDPSQVDAFHPGNTQVVQNPSVRAAPPPVGQVGGPARRGPGGRLFGRGAPVVGTNPAAPVPDVFVPEYALIRILDVTVKPGKSYQYRIRVRMANPNLLRGDAVGDVEDKPENKELKPVDPKKMWFVVPGIVTLPEEMHYYAVDQKPVVTGTATTPGRNQTTLQIHRYLETAMPRKGEYVAVGEWAVAERVLVSRGEVIDRPVRVEVPVLVEELTVQNAQPKNKEIDWFRLPSTLTGTRREPGFDVDFSSGVPGRPAILVDFHGGQTEKLQHDGQEIKERSAQEVLIMGPDGKLLAHNVNVDTENPQRKATYEAWKTRVTKLRDGGKGDPRNPLNPMTPGGIFDRR